MSTQGQEGAGTERQAGARRVRSLNVSVTQNDAKNPGSHHPEILAPFLSLPLSRKSAGVLLELLSPLKQGRVGTSLH